MTVTFERPATLASSRWAIATIDRYRDVMEDQFEVQPLDAEFAFFVRRLGASGLYLADAAANKAGTFKWRGAMNKMTALQEEGVESVIVPSAGNHLRGAVLSAKALGMVIHGAVPTSAPPAKKEGARALWPNSGMFQLHVTGDSFDETLDWVKSNPQLGTLVHPYDDELVAAGQGTIVDDTIAAFERRGEQLQHLVVPVGGGGLLSGVARRALELDPALTVHGVEAEGSDSLSRSIAMGSVTEATRPNKRYGGSAVKQTGRHTLATYDSLPNIRLWGVDDGEVQALAEDYGDEITYRELHKYPDYTPFEPTTLVAIAGLAQIARQHAGETIAVVGTGRNDLLDSVWR